MRYLKTSEAARLLNVSPNTLRTWEARFGFPEPLRSPGRHRYYTHGELVALQAALHDGLSISSAVLRARRALATDTTSLIAGLACYDHERADRAIETALGMCTVAGAVEDVMLSGLEEIVRRHGLESAAWAFAARWAVDWLRRAKDLAPPPVRPIAILLGDASRDELDLDAVYIRAFELFCVRAGIKVLSLSARAVGGIGDAVAAHRPNIVVLAGDGIDAVTVARWGYAVRRTVAPLSLAVYRRGTIAAGNTVLPGTPEQAHLRLLELVEAERSQPDFQPTRVRTGASRYP